MLILRPVCLPTHAANRPESRVDRASTTRRGCRGRGTPTLSDIRLVAACNTMTALFRQALESNRAAIRDIAARHRVRDVRVFGSVLRGTDTDGSDLDLLVEPTEQTTLLDIGKIQFELSELLGIGVDVLTPAALPERLREKFLAEAQPV